MDHSEKWSLRKMSLSEMVHFEIGRFEKWATLKNESLRKLVTTKSIDSKNGPLRKMSHLEIDRFEKFATTKNESLRNRSIRKIGHFEI